LKYYFDASALVKRFKPERGQATVRDILHHALLGEHEIHSIDWARAEFYVAMRRSNVPQKLAAKNLKTLAEVVEFDPLTRDTMDNALGLIYEFHLHAADAMHLSACTELSCDAMLTDDEHLVSKEVMEHLEKQAVKLVNLEENP